MPGQTRVRRTADVRLVVVIGRGDRHRCGGRRNFFLRNNRQASFRISRRRRRTRLQEAFPATAESA